MKFLEPGVLTDKNQWIKSSNFLNPFYNLYKHSGQASYGFSRCGKISQGAIHKFVNLERRRTPGPRATTKGRLHKGH